MNEQPSKEDEVVTVPPKKSSKSNKTVLIVIGVIVGIFLLFGLVAAVIGVLAYNKVADTVGDSMKEVQKEMQADNDKSQAADDEYDRYAADDNDATDEHGGRAYATKHGLPSEFPKVPIVKPMELKQITSQAKAKGETPIRWRLITESEMSTASKTRSAIESTFSNFGEKVEMPGFDVKDDTHVMLRYATDRYDVTVSATQETEYQKGPVGNFIIVYDIQVKE